MRFSQSMAFAGLASLMLGGCAGWDWDRFARLPVVCPSSVDLDPGLRQQGLARFRPFVENRGVDDLSEPFTVAMRVTRSSGGEEIEVLKHTFVPNGAIIVGTHAVPGVKAGPEVELTTTSTQGSRETRYDQAALYTVKLTFNSPNAAIAMAGDGCRELTVKFRGGEPV